MTLRPPAAIVDVDGTLVDSNYQHALAWYRALQRFEITAEIRSLHRLIGMGGDHLVVEVAGQDAEDESGEAIRDAEKEIYTGMIDEISPLPCARELLKVLGAGGRRVVLASSGDSGQVDHYLQLLDARELVDDWTTADDVDATKPEPDLVQAALEKAGGGPAVMIGDSTWDCVAARRAGIQTVAVLTGGFARDELDAAGAVAVFESLSELIDRLGMTPLGDGAG